MKDLRHPIDRDLLEQGEVLLKCGSATDAQKFLGVVLERLRLVTTPLGNYSMDELAELSFNVNAAIREFGDV